MISQKLRNHIIKKILILGFTFKENCKDHRNTKIFDLYKALLSKKFAIDIFDPIVDRDEVFQNYNIKILKSLRKKKYDGVFIAVKHDFFKN